MNILLVEDERYVASIIKKGPEEEFYAVDIAENGPKGLSMAVSKAYGVFL